MPMFACLDAPERPALARPNLDPHYPPTLCKCMGDLHINAPD